MLRKTVEYALRAVVCMGTHVDRPLSADIIAKQTKVPRRYLNRVLQDLCSSGLVQSRPGPGGGYELICAISKLTILDVIKTVEPIARIENCPFGVISHISLCRLHTELDNAYEAMEKKFAGITICDLIDSERPFAPFCDGATLDE